MSHMPTIEQPEGVAAVASTRAINTTSPIQGGGDLSSDRTISLADLGVATGKIADSAVTLAKMADIATARFLGRTTAGTGAPEAITGTAATALLDLFTTSAKGLVPVASGGNTTTEFLRKDGTWDVPAGSGVGSGVGWYNVEDNGLVDDGTTSNTSALNTLIATVLAAGGGTIYFPAPSVSWHFGPGAPATASMRLTSQGLCNLRFLGDGPESLLTWGGDMGGADHYMFELYRGNSHITFEKLRMVQKDLTNPDASEHHGFIHLVTKTTGNNEHIKVIDCEFGVTKGDVINMTGGTDAAACHASFLATVAAGAIAGPFTSPTLPQRVTATFTNQDPTHLWDGGDIVVTGTDLNGKTISETLASNPGTTVAGKLEFKTVVSATKSATGTNTSTCSIGFCYLNRYVYIERCYMNGFEYEGSNPGYGYRAAIVAQRFSEHIYVQRCFMTGSDDQLIDFEPSGEGNCGPWYIDDNIIITNSVVAAGAPDPCITLFGNGDDVPNRLHEYSSFRRNWVWGRIFGGKLNYVTLEDNRIFGDRGVATSGALIGLIDGNTDVNIVNNYVVPPDANFTGKTIVVEGGGGIYPKNVSIRGNTVFFYIFSAIQLTDATHSTIAGNRAIFMGTTSAVKDGITVTSPAANTDHIAIDGNTFEARGTGTMRRGISFSPSASGNNGTRITNNHGTGVATAGVFLASGTYSAPVIEYNNQFPAATSNVSIQADVPIVVDYDVRPVTNTSGNLQVYSKRNKISINGTVAYTLPNGVTTGQEMSITCTVAAATPKGTLTITSPHSGQPSTYLFTAVDQHLLGRWDGTDWRVFHKVRVGSQTAVLGTDTVSGMVATVNLSVTGTVSGALPNGAVHGEMVQVRCTTASGTPAGTLTGAYKALDGTTTTNAAFDATTDYFVGQWDGTHWLILASNGVTFS